MIQSQFQKKLLENTSYNFKIISELDNGIYDAMNKGISIATGDIIGIINADDWYDNTALETIQKNYQGEIYAVLYGLVRFIDGNKVKKIILISHDYIKNQVMMHPGVFITKKTYDVYGTFYTKYKCASDYEILLRFSFEENIQFIRIDNVISNYRSGGYSNKNKFLCQKETNDIKYQLNVLNIKGKIKMDIKIFKEKVTSNLGKIFKRG